MIRTTLALLAALALASPASAQVYKCKDAAGKTVYSDTRCGFDANELSQGRLNANVASSGRRADDEDGAGAPLGKGRNDRKDQCFELLEGKLKPTQRRAIGAVCGADIDDATFRDCVVKLLEPQTPSSYEAIAHMCTGQAIPTRQVQSGPKHCITRANGMVFCP